ncbi:branched-chain amino acid transport [Kiloniella spongiae]|uniref:Branched-chain amino acid transport n=1 Tax=Kiloniella spongiae TaxID=1489064 RepID=A0A0H2MGN6_9PROT|nr:AzlD domain-containing protein [Kiloniella spongiae]KLN61754.1 branched-chain amino acid transport [Kiloniella spongiae]
MHDTTIFLILACALATYATRTGGHLVLSRFGTTHHRLEAALEAVPTAVLAALVAPSMVINGPAEAIAIALAGLIALRYSLVLSVLSGIVCLIVLRGVLI